MFQGTVNGVTDAYLWASGKAGTEINPNPLHHDDRYPRETLRKAGLER